jgi:hypothetical protein
MSQSNHKRLRRAATHWLPRALIESALPDVAVMAESLFPLVVDGSNAVNAISLTVQNEKVYIRSPVQWVMIRGTGKKARGFVNRMIPFTMPRGITQTDNTVIADVIPWCKEPYFTDAERENNFAECIDALQQRWCLMEFIRTMPGKCRDVERRAWTDAPGKAARADCVLCSP